MLLRLLCPCFLSSFLSFHFPIEICTRFVSVAISAVDSKLLHIVRNGLKSRLDMEILPKIKKLQQIYYLHATTTAMLRTADS